MPTAGNALTIINRKTFLYEDTYKMKLPEKHSGSFRFIYHAINTLTHPS